MGYEFLGLIVWKAAKWSLRREARALRAWRPSRPLAIGAVLAAVVVVIALAHRGPRE